MYTIRIKLDGRPKWKFLEHHSLGPGHYIFIVGETPKTFFTTKLKAKKVIDKYRSSYYKMESVELRIVHISLKTVYKDKV